MFDTRPDHWIAYTGPACWFRLSHPPGWRREESRGMLHLYPPHGGMLTINCFWRAEQSETSLESLLAIDRLFPRRRKMRRLPPLDVDARVLGFSGEAVIPDGSSWWKRLFRRPAWRPWHLWALRSRSICLVATLLQTGEPDPELATLVRMVLSSIEFAAEPADPPEQFTARVLELARRKFPLLKCEPAEDFQLRIGESNVNLVNFYRSYVHAPDQFEQIVLPALATVVQVQEWGQEQMQPPLDAVEDRIMPMLYPEAVWRERFPSFAGETWVGGLVILYVVDESQAYWYIRDDLLQKWGLSLDDLHQRALRNLDRYFEDSPMQFSFAGEAPGPLLLLPDRRDAYNTVRLLSPTFQQHVRELLGTEYAVGVPSRDFFVAVNLASTEAVQQVQQKVAEDFQQMDHPLTERMLLVTADGVSEYQAP